MPDGATPMVEEESRVIRIPLALVSPMPGQPRIVFDQEEIDLLAASIGSKGQQVPGEVVAVGEGDNKTYQLVDGERRWRACQQAQVGTYRAIVLGHVDDFNADELYRRSCVANFSREGHTPHEELMMVQRYLGMGLKVAEIARDLGKQPMWVSQRKTILERAAEGVLDKIAAEKVPISVLKQITDLEPSQHTQHIDSYIAGDLKMPQLVERAHKARVKAGLSREISSTTKADQLKKKLENWLNYTVNRFLPSSDDVFVAMSTDTVAQVVLESLIERLQEIKKKIDQDD